jgi:hypothetical protein
MAGELLLDTGALVSLLDESQARHREFVDFFDSWRGAVVSSEAVLTEATHLLGGVRGGTEACVEFFIAGGAVVVPSSQATLRRCSELLRKFADLPMDFADATLVALAEELQTDLVFTTDRRDFSLYRWNRARRFQIRP